ncbi:TetR/AcrR family transcriptional regulator [Arhodomonas sp. SL1]|uniref:TetR/AcrR family transcriptional regulator n=1 Tax=Arhodomonas sp. SL1 TaxID=3425691 RepID=UPI003F885E08
MENRRARDTLRAEDWAEAALQAIAAEGMRGLSVEPLARTLGVTKGSFYWHFRNRNALLEAALALWERRETDEVLARAAEETDPRKRLARLFREADGSRRAGRLYLTLAGASDQPLIAAVVRRVMERRLEFLQECYRALGATPEQAGARAVLAYSMFLGTLQLRRDAPDVLPQGEGFHEYMHLVGESLIPGYDRELVRRR